MDLEKVVAHYGANAVEFHRVTNQVEARFVALTQRFTQAAAGGGLVGGLLGAGAGIAAVSAITAIEAPLRLVATGIRDIIDLTATATGEAVRLSMEWEKSAIAFEVMTKSASRGQRLLGDLQQLAIETPYRTSQMVHFGEVLLGYGTPPEDVIPAIARLGDIAGGNVDKFRRLALAFGQVLTAGRFMGQEKRQFAEAGVGLEDFAETAGMTSRQFVEAMERGEIGADVMVRTINRLTNEGGRFFGLMQRINLETVGGQFDAFMERLERFGRFIFAGDRERGIRGLFERFGVGDFIGGMSRRLDAIDLSPWLDAFEGWARRGMDAISPLQESARIISERFAQWGEANEGLVPTWEEVRSIIQDINQNQLPAFLNWIERQAAETKKLAQEVKSVWEFWSKLVQHTTSTDGKPNTVFTVKVNGEELAQKAGDAARNAGLLGPEEKEAARRRYLTPAQRMAEDFARSAEDRRQAFIRMRDAAGAGTGIPIPLDQPMSVEELVAQYTATPNDRLPEMTKRVMRAFQWRRQTQFALTGGAAFFDPWDLQRLPQPFRLPANWDVHAVPPAAIAGVGAANAPLTPMPSMGLGALMGGYAGRGFLPPSSLLPAAEIGVPLVDGLTKEQRRLMRALGLQEGEGFELGGFGRFQRRMHDLNQLASFSRFRGPGFAAAGGVMGAMTPHITEEQYQRGAFDAYQQLVKDYGRSATPQLAPAMLAGSSAAQDVINQAMVQPANAVERAIGVLEAARQETAALRTIAEQIMPILQSIEANSGVVSGEDE